MNGKGPRLPVDILKIYFKNLKMDDGKRKVEINLRSDWPHIAFEVSVEVKEPSYEGAFPQRRISLERHEDHGHEGVHLQIWYHLVENKMDIGSLYIGINVNDNRNLEDIAEGFVFTIYEVLKEMGPEFKDIVDELFFIELVEEIKEKKSLLLEKIRESLEKRYIEIRREDDKKPILVDPEDIRILLRSRKELIPLLGPLVEGS